MHTIVFEQNIYIVKTDGIAVGYFQNLSEAEIFFNKLGNPDAVTIEDSRPYKIYSCLLKNTEVIVLEDTIGLVLWSRQNVGLYQFEKNAGFPMAKTLIFCAINIEYSAPENARIAPYHETDDLIQFAKFDNNDPDAQMSDLSDTKPASIEIRVYN